MKTKLLLLLLFVLLSSCSIVADNELVGDWGAKELKQFFVDGVPTNNLTSGDLVIFSFIENQGFAVHWLVNTEYAEYKCYAADGKLEYWEEGDYANKQETSYSISGDALKIDWDGKEVKIYRL